MAKDDANILDDPYRARKMKVRSVTTQEWQEFVESLPDYSFFQLPTWAQVHEKAFAACEVATKLFSFDDDVQVLLPLVKTKDKFGFETLESLPWGWYGGFVWRKKPSEAQIRQILGHLLAWRVLHLGIYPGPWGGGLPESQVIPLAYFESLFRLGGDRVKCHLARYDNKYISGGFTAYDSSGCIYLHEALLKEYGYYCPNNLLRNKLI